MKMIDFIEKIVITCLRLSAALFFLFVISLLVRDVWCGSGAICEKGVALASWLSFGCLATTSLALFFASILACMSLNERNW